MTTRVPNRLANSLSPYLRQHAGNPVDWYPWGEEAFARARAEDRPIFLSVGYAACHWCHVMERECFEDDAIAELLNSRFVAIKVDREERPDVDEVYMTAVQLLTGQGGWPMSVFLTPDLQPFFGGTYYPPEPRGGMIGFRPLLETIDRMWKTRRNAVLDSAASIVAALQREDAARDSDAAAASRPDLIRRAIAEFSATFDAARGGFGGAPKFPPAAALAFLLGQRSLRGGDGLPAMVATTLDRMACGGIFDHVGGGFHRYATDAGWLVPHFEKMLYDQATLAPVYLDAFVLSGNASYADTALATLDYVCRDMTDPAGGFHASQDADSEGEEGRYYVWSYDEIGELLGPDANAFRAAFGVTPDGNFEGRTILHCRVSVAGQEEALRRLREARSRRIPPGKDDKTIASWNGLMISALCRGAAVLGDARYREAALRAGDFLRRSMMRGDGQLMRVWRAGETSVTGYADDYAAVANAFLDLYEISGDPAWIDAAEQLAARLVGDFLDPAQGGFFLSSAGHGVLPARNKPFQDGPVPSANGMAALLLIRLGRLLGRDEWIAMVAETLAGATLMRDYPSAFPTLLRACDLLGGDSVEIVVAGKDGDPAFHALWRAAEESYVPGRILMHADPDVPALADRFPLLQHKGLVDGRPAAFVCKNRVCGAPVTDARTLASALR